MTADSHRLYTETTANFLPYLGGRQDCCDWFSNSNHQVKNYQMPVRHAISGHGANAYLASIGMEPLEEFFDCFSIVIYCRLSSHLLLFLSHSLQELYNTRCGRAIRLYKSRLGANHWRTTQSGSLLLPQKWLDHKELTCCFLTTDAAQILIFFSNLSRLSCMLNEPTEAC